LPTPSVATLTQVQFLSTCGGIRSKKKKLRGISQNDDTNLKIEFLKIFTPLKFIPHGHLEKACENNGLSAAFPSNREGMALSYELSLKNKK
jgi:hypothetical protein